MGCLFFSIFLINGKTFNYLLHKSGVLLYYICIHFLAKIDFPLYI